MDNAGDFARLSDVNSMQMRILAITDYTPEQPNKYPNPTIFHRPVLCLEALDTDRGPTRADSRRSLAFAGSARADERRAMALAVPTTHMRQLLPLCLQGSGVTVSGTSRRRRSSVRSSPHLKEAQPRGPGAYPVWIPSPLYLPTWRLRDRVSEPAGSS